MRGLGVTTESYIRDTKDSLETPLAVEEKYYWILGYGGDANKLSTRDWYLEPYRAQLVTGGLDTHARSRLGLHPHGLCYPLAACLRLALLTLSLGSALAPPPPSYSCRANAAATAATLPAAALLTTLPR